MAVNTEDNGSENIVLELDAATIEQGVKLARETLLADLATAEEVGELVSVRAEAPRVATILFAYSGTTYEGWLWAVSVTQVADDAPLTVLETELIAGENSIVAPEWVPWSVRLAQFREARAAAAAEEAAAAAAAHEELDEDDVDPEDDLLENDFTDFDDEMDGIDIDELDDSDSEDELDSKDEPDNEDESAEDSEGD
ncbi:DUF3027 domain-containing protein [Canibacter zhoujuaniae]|uniref:DUF3027 domain-containing protein n=1 Tax=Canibacter zhoujuaniae TaxID=2708343 RepID=UPI001424A16C|nr:DUF3027 domain-containing protein [Canibacter zhoujuaniae]